MPALQPALQELSKDFQELEAEDADDDFFCDDDDGDFGSYRGDEADWN
jgi:hypothetical protein